MIKCIAILLGLISTLSACSEGENPLNAPADYADYVTIGKIRKHETRTVR